MCCNVHGTPCNDKIFIVNNHWRRQTLNWVKLGLFRSIEAGNSHIYWYRQSSYSKRIGSVYVSKGKSSFWNIKTTFSCWHKQNFIAFSWMLSQIQFHCIKQWWEIFWSVGKWSLLTKLSNEFTYKYILLILFETCRFRLQYWTFSLKIHVIPLIINVEQCKRLK